jgi:anti-sigma factor RsiW
MTCAELEILLCDYVDGTLRAEEKSALESHLAGCSACTELAKDVAGATAFLERVSAAEPPAELLTRILHHAPQGRQRGQDRQPWWRRLFGGWLESVLTPRYAMGMAMTILSFSMLARFTGIEPRQLTPQDLDPVKIWQSIDDRSHRIWDRAVKYYDNLRLVIEVQSRLKEWTDQEQAQATETSKQSADSAAAPASPAHPEDGRNDKR